jgi:hypothetical protein
MTLSILDNPPDEFSVGLERNTELTADQRARQKESFEAWASALQAARRRVMPLAIAELLLGASMVVFAQRATVGRAWARQALVQLTIAHVGLSVLEWVLTPDVRKPLYDLQMALNNLDTKEVPAGAPQLVQLALGIGVGAITVLGMTVRGSRAFYASMEQLTER